MENAVTLPAKGATPTAEELETALSSAVKLAMWKRHRGRPPKTMNWEDLFQEVFLRAFARMKKFRHGGPKKITEYAYMAACYALTDIQREDIRAARSVRISEDAEAPAMNPSPALDFIRDDIRSLASDVVAEYSLFVRASDQVRIHGLRIGELVCQFAAREEVLQYVEELNRGRNGRPQTAHCWVSRAIVRVCHDSGQRSLTEVYLERCARAWMKAKGLGLPPESSLRTVEANDPSKSESEPLAQPSASGAVPAELVLQNGECIKIVVDREIAKLVGELAQIRLVSIESESPRAALIVLTK